jgi:hypothetical protein
VEPSRQDHRHTSPARWNSGSTPVRTDRRGKVWFLRRRQQWTIDRLQLRPIAIARTHCDGTARPRDCDPNGYGYLLAPQHVDSAELSLFQQTVPYHRLCTRLGAGGGTRSTGSDRQGTHTFTVCWRHGALRQCCSGRPRSLLAIREPGRWLPERVTHWLPRAGAVGRSHHDRTEALPRLLLRGPRRGPRPGASGQSALGKSTDRYTACRRFSSGNIRSCCSCVRER